MDCQALTSVTGGEGLSQAEMRGIYNPFYGCTALHTPVILNNILLFVSANDTLEAYAACALWLPDSDQSEKTTLLLSASPFDRLPIFRPQRQLSQLETGNGNPCINTTVFPYVSHSLRCDYSCI